ncbi:hypothetical protein Mgra_00003497 [Meloidogyne graminicola]|uniref:Uncharacterized protein n=1 Tax=Meloidogyne graminicola TaxID=189291 RepID=A0A8S9ZU56_9BILA|nr:hypothetical protein Mgra_00003497 [Meloidogyne graminicola]
MIPIKTIIIFTFWVILVSEQIFASQPGFETNDKEDERQQVGKDVGIQVGKNIGKGYTYNKKGRGKKTNVGKDIHTIKDETHFGKEMRITKDEGKETHDTENISNDKKIMMTKNTKTTTEPCNTKTCKECIQKWKNCKIIPTCQSCVSTGKECDRCAQDCETCNVDCMNCPIPCQAPNSMCTKCTGQKCLEQDHVNVALSLEE